MNKRQSDSPAIDVSVLFVSFNRSDLLARAVSSVRDRLNFEGLAHEFIVTDDASDPRHMAVIRALDVDRILTAGRNTGIGANCNRGLRSCRGEFILQIQDDCEFIGSHDLLYRAIEIMRHDSDVGIVQLTRQASAVPHDVRRLRDGTQYLLFMNDGLPRRRECGMRPYSDQPHLKRRSFVLDVGPYAEGKRMTVTEISYQQRVACQSRWRVAHLPQEQSFRHLGADRSFNDSWLRGKRLERIEQYPVIGPLFGRSRPYLRTMRNVLRGLAGN
jgi:glycosyltransferase involved in cell wall biosynthesis